MSAHTLDFNDIFKQTSQAVYRVRVDFKTWSLNETENETERQLTIFSIYSLNYDSRKRRKRGAQIYLRKVRRYFRSKYQTYILHKS